MTCTRSLMGALALLLAAQPAAAQMFGNPVYVPVGQGTGVNISGDWGRGLNNASGKGNYFGGRAILGLPFFYVMAGAGTYKADGATASQTAFGGALGLNVLRLPMMPVKVSIQAGGGYVKAGTLKQVDIPVSLGIGLALPTPGVSITPWVAPRLHVRILSGGSLLDTQTDARFGGSAGLNVSFGMIGAHLAADYIKLPGSGTSPLTFGAGLHLALTLPGL